MSKIGKWFKSIINWFKRLFKKKEKPSSGTTQPTPPTPPQPSGYNFALIVNTLTSWEETKLFREYVAENNIVAVENDGEIEFNSSVSPEEVLKAIASGLLFALGKSEERYHNLRIRKIEEWNK